MPNRHKPELPPEYEEAMREGWQPPPAAHGPIHNPIDRYLMLPPQIREWLEQLREDDISKLKELGRFSSDDIAALHEAILFHRSAKTIGRFSIRVVIFVVTTFTGGVLFGEKLQIAWKWILSRGGQ